MVTAYERRLVLFYLSNAVSRLHYGTDRARNLVRWLLKHEEELKLQHLLTRSDETEGERVRQRSSDQEVSPVEWQRLGEALRNEFAAVRNARPDRTARRLRRLAMAMHLTRTDTAILELLICHQTNHLVESMLDYIFEDTEWVRPTSFTHKAFSCILGLSVNTVRKRFASGAPLMASGLVSIDEIGQVRLIDRVIRLHWLPNEAGSDVQRLLLDEAKPGDLRWSDFDHVADDRDHVERILKGALRTGGKGVNILLYGPPGTGKTEFCKTLAARLEAPLYAVGEVESGGEPSRYDRLQELQFAQGLLAGDRRSVLLFDEMEDLFSHQGGRLAELFGSRRFAGLPVEGSKVFMNRLLEETPVPTLWTSNAAKQTSPVLLRRMMFALELRQPPSKVRARVWARQLARHGIEWSEKDASSLAREFDVTPGVASGVTAAARLGDGTIADVRRGVRGLARVLSGDAPPVQRTPQKFDPGLIRADMDMVQLADRLAGSGTRYFSLCLQGPPGTGKSAFIRHLAERLELEVMQKRASDLMSMWVGETEQQIAKAFVEARDAEAFLVFDEADSLLADRRLAERSWEVSQVNEMLTWMESHPFPFACTTNFGERLDPARAAALHVQDRPRLSVTQAGRGPRSVLISALSPRPKSLALLSSPPATSPSCAGKPRFSTACGTRRRFPKCCAPNAKPSRTVRGRRAFGGECRARWMNGSRTRLEGKENKKMPKQTGNDVEAHGKRD